MIGFIEIFLAVGAIVIIIFPKMVGLGDHQPEETRKNFKKRFGHEN